MNQTFDIHRFTLMLRLDLAEKGKNYLFTAALLIGLLLLLMLPVGFSKEFSAIKEMLQYMALFMIVLFGSSLYTSSVFNPYSSPSTGIAALMVPASAFEKFLTSLLTNLVFIVPFIFMYWQLHYSTIEAANAKIPIAGNKYNHLPDFVMKYACYYYFIIQAFIFLGSIYFTKASYIKTASLFIGIFLTMGILQLTLAYYFTSFPSKVVTFPITGWQIWHYGGEGTLRNLNDTRYYNVVFPEIIAVMIQCFPVFIVLTLWFVTYLRLREKEI
jgi:hypothetical protein